MRLIRVLLAMTGLAVIIAVGMVVGAHYRAIRTTAPAGSPWEKVEPTGSTPADARIRSAQLKIDRAPNAAAGYNQLSSAFMQKARESGDFGFNARAEAALDQAQKADPADYDSIKLRAKLLLTYHRFSDALVQAQRAQQLRPQDHDVYGALTDAYVELGQYDEAIKTAQTMVNLRPDTASYSRVSYLRTLHGDTEGAMEAMNLAARMADPNDGENGAWCRVQLGNELLSTGKIAAAEQQYDQALQLFPEYHFALAGKGQSRATMGDLMSAIEFYRRAQTRVPLPETAIALGDLYTKTGNPEEARRQFALVEFIEGSGASGGTYSRVLAVYYADHDLKLDQALKLAQAERAVRNDIYSNDALAWALFKSGQFDAAEKEMKLAMRLKTKDARLFFHAGVIADARGQRQRSAGYLKQALAINPAFDLRHADEARQLLAKEGVQPDRLPVNAANRLKSSFR
ncbi:MAG: tetratricopeptide repeat protein [Pyrinomonadaceae bacterium]